MTLRRATRRGAPTSRSSQGEDAVGDRGAGEATAGDRLARDRLAALTAAHGRDRAVALAARAVARAHGVALPGAEPHDVPPWIGVSFDALAAAYEALQDDPTSPSRRARGAWYTPPALVAHLLDVALEPALAAAARAPDPVAALLAIRVLDPACGAGNLLVAAARRITGRIAALGGGDRAADVVGACLHGVDVDPAAITLCRAALRTLARAPCPALDAHVRQGDSLLDPQPVGGTFDVVIGNPPFLTQLGADTAASAAARARLAARFGRVKQAYTDAATLFLVAGVEALRPGGRLAMVHPQSLFAASHAAPARRALLTDAALTDVWTTVDPIFPDALVTVCVVGLERGGPRAGEVARRFGNTFAPAPAATVDQDALRDAPTWGALLGDLLGVPAVDLPGPAAVGDLATTTADFRDQFYGLIPFVQEGGPDAPAFPRLVVTGLVDPAALRWGERSCRFGKRAWERPRVDLAALTAEGTLAAWARGRLVPKLVVATQTRVIEAVADPDGTLLNTVPTITVVPHDPADLWRLLAVLLAPPVTAWAAGRYAGVALATDALKLSAAQVGGLPLPSPGAAWERAAGLVREASRAGDEEQRGRLLDEAGVGMCEAYGVPAEPVLSWWRARRG